MPTDGIAFIYPFESKCISYIVDVSDNCYAAIQLFVIVA